MSFDSFQFIVFFDFERPVSRTDFGTGAHSLLVPRLAPVAAVSLAR